MDNEPCSFRDRLQDMLATYGAAFLWVLTASVLLTLLVIIASASNLIWHPLSVSLVWLDGFQPMLKTAPRLTASAAIIVAPILEEALFRVLPLWLARRYDRGDGALPLFVSVVICGALFGLLHGGVINVFLQGVVGFLLARLFLRNSDRSVVTGYLCCVAVHATYNFSVFFGSLLRF